MRCDKVKELLLAYLDEEVDSSDRALIQAHLAECEACRQELAILSRVRERISQHFQVQASNLSPSPQAWSRLEANLSEALRLSLFQRLIVTLARAKQALLPQGKLALKQGGILAAIGVLLVIVGALVFIPSIKVQAEGIIAQWLHLKAPAGSPKFKIILPSSELDFNPLYPTYLPSGLIYTVEGGVRGAKAFRQVYGGKDWFVEIVQLKASAYKPLPSGQKVSINELPATLKTGLQGKFKPIPDFKMEGHGLFLPVYSYVNGKQLTWYVGEIKVEMLSNLSVEEMLKIAKSMKPQERR